MRNYLDLYLKYNALLLRNVFEKFRNRCLESYSLCPSHYLRAPALSLNAMLSMAKFEKDLISDVDMYFFLQKGIRGVTSHFVITVTLCNNTLST